VPDQALRAILEGVIEREPLLAAEALEAVQLGSDGAPANFEGLKAAAAFVGETPQHFIVQGLAKQILLKAFALSLSIRRATLPEGWEAALDEVSETRLVGLDATERPAAADEVEAPEEEEGEPDEADGDEGDDALARATVSDEARAQFERLVKSTRCRIRVDGRAVGSGFLVGPSTVLTAWHVIRDAEPPAEARVDVDLADGSRIPAVLPARFNSRCGDRELDDFFPENDNEVAGKHDIALLRLRRPVGAALGSVQVAGPDIRLKTNDMMILVHYPEAKYRGFSYGIFYKLRALTARWGHSVEAKGGSSGGGCFNSSLLLAGIHQGRAPKQPKQRSDRAPRSRLVPAALFPDQVRQMIAEDQAPPQLWSLDGTANGPLVVGRQDFFTAFAAANGPSSRVRGIRIKRVDAEAGVTGLPFSYRMLEFLIGRTVDLGLLLISLQTVIEDFTDEVVRRARLAGYDIGPVAGEPGVEADQTTEEAAASDRARRSAILLDGLAAAAGVRLWIFLDHPSAAFGDRLRASFEGFVDQALKLNNLRLVVAGYEAMSVPGQEFRYPYEAEGEGAPGMMTEFLDGFRRSDVVHLISLAAKELGVPVTDDLVSHIADGALGGMEAIGGVYGPKLAGALIDALRPELLQLAQRQPAGGGQGHG
jgi:V8-like Glu-specific endopeptidase